MSKNNNQMCILLVVLISTAILHGTMQASEKEPIINQDIYSGGEALDMVTKWQNAMQTRNYTTFWFSAYDNVDLQSIASDENWDGDGTPANPYIITGYNFSGFSTHPVYFSTTGLHVILRDNIFLHNDQGIAINRVSNITITGNYFAHNHYGIHINTLNSSLLHNNTFYHNEYGVSSGITEGLEVSQNFFVEHSVTAYDTSDDNISFQYNIFFNNSLALDMDTRGFNVSYNDFIQGGRAIAVREHQNGSFVHNTFNNVRGIRIEFSQDIIIDHNTFANTSGYGVSYRSTGNTTLTNNIFTDSYFTILDRSIYEHFIQTKVENNTINGRPMLFIQNESGTTYTGNYAHVFIVNCSHITLKNLNIYDISDQGILLFGSHHISVVNTSIKYTGEGIRALFTDYLTVTNSTLTNNTHGIKYWASDNSFINNNNFENNFVNALHFESNHHRVYRNNFIYNAYFEDFGGYFAPQVYFDGFDADFDYNYWHDHLNPDNNNDSVVDIPYVIESGSYLDVEDPHPVTRAYNISNPVPIVVQPVVPTTTSSSSTPTSDTSSLSSSTGSQISSSSTSTDQSTSAGEETSNIDLLPVWWLPLGSIAILTTIFPRRKS